MTPSAHARLTPTLTKAAAGFNHKHQQVQVPVDTTTHPRAWEYYYQTITYSTAPALEPPRFLKHLHGCTMGKDLDGLQLLIPLKTAPCVQTPGLRILQRPKAQINHPSDGS
jgi:hypothetical protein